jgi:hypothetical protein
MKVINKKIKSELKLVKEQLKTNSKIKLKQERSKSQLVIESLKNDFETLKQNLLKDKHSNEELKDSQILELKFNLEKTSYEHSCVLKELCLANTLLNKAQLEIANKQQELETQGQIINELESDKLSLTEQLTEAIKHFGSSN